MSQQEFVLVLFQVVVLVLAFSVHESAHAYVAMRLGDPTAYMLGRVTLNPAKHLDPLGSVLVPLISLVYGGWLIGWAKPCPVTTRNFRHLRRDDILVSMAGPASNLAMATVRSPVADRLQTSGCREACSPIAAAMATANHIPWMSARCLCFRWRCCSTTASHQPAAACLQPDPDPAAGRQPRSAPLSALPRGAGIQPDRDVRPHRPAALWRTLDRELLLSVDGRLRPAVALAVRQRHPVRFGLRTL